MSVKAYVEVEIDFGGNELFPHQHGVLWETPGSAPGLEVTPLQLGFLPTWVIPINCGSFEKLLNFSLGKWVCTCSEPVLGDSNLKMTKPDLPKVFFSKLSGMLGATPLSGITIIWGLAWVFGGLWGVSGGHIGRYSMGPKCSRGAIYFSASIHTRKLFFWLKALYPYSMLPFESR